MGFSLVKNQYELINLLLDFDSILSQNRRQTTNIYDISI